MKPNDINTIELLIPKEEFALILEGKLLEVSKEIDNASYTRLLDVDGDGVPFFNDALLDRHFDPTTIAGEDTLTGIIHMWNNGRYPLIPNQELAFVHLYEEGGERSRGEVVLPLREIYFRPVMSSTKNPLRFRVNEEDDSWLNDPEGPLCLWQMVMVISPESSCR